MRTFAIIVAVLIIIGALAYTFTRKSGGDLRIPIEPNPQPRACTEEAMLCPDGSAVGRTGPNCEFAPCP